MEVIINVNGLENFKAWAGGLDTLNDLKKLGKRYSFSSIMDTVEEYIEEMFIGLPVPTETQINDFLWFERDTIAEILGYKDYDELLEQIEFTPTAEEVQESARKMMPEF